MINVRTRPMPVSPTHCVTLAVASMRGPTTRADGKVLQACRSATEAWWRVALWGDYFLTPRSPRDLVVFRHGARVRAARITIDRGPTPDIYGCRLEKAPTPDGEARAEKQTAVL